MALGVHSTRAADAVIADAFNGSAAIKLHRITKLDGQDHGLGYSTHKALFDTCNNLRAAFYQLPPSTIDEAVLRSLDEQTVEKYYKDGRAATFITGRLLDFTDLKRWNQEQRSSPKPAQPPDCAAYAIKEHKTGTIWRDGQRYQLNYENRRAIGAKADADFVARPLMPPSDFLKLPKELIQTRECRWVTAPVREFLDGRACLWSDVPPVRWLNWPWALESESRLGMPQKLVQTDNAVNIERNGAIPPGVFDIPVGFDIRMAPPR